MCKWQGELTYLISNDEINIDFINLIFLVFRIFSLSYLDEACVFLSACLLDNLLIGTFEFDEV